MMKKIVKIAMLSTGIIAVTSFIPKGLAGEGPYKSRNISDVRTSLALSERVRSENGSINITISYESDSYDSLRESYPSVRVSQMAKDSIDLIVRFNNSKAIPTRDCRSNYNLNIFILSNSTMWDTGRFSNFPGMTYSGHSGSIVYGIYDPTPKVAANSNILLTGVSGYEDYLSTHHELAHYWWDRLCIQKFYNGNSESYALGYERFIGEMYDVEH
jgi:hypothetical protein